MSNVTLSRTYVLGMMMISLSVVLVGALQFSAVRPSHGMHINSLCQMNSPSCCNGLECKFHKNAVCCAGGEFCCPMGSICLPGVQPSCGYPIQVHAPNYEPCKCPAPAPCTENGAVCQSPPPCGCPHNTRNGAPNINPLEVAIRSLISQHRIIPPSVWDLYNSNISPVIVHLHIKGHSATMYHENTPQRFQFIRTIVHDITSVLSIESTQISVRNITGAMPLVVDIKVFPASPKSMNQQSPLELARKLERFVRDEHSLLLKHGQITKFLDHTFFRVSPEWTDTQQSSAQQMKLLNSSTTASPKSPTANS